jgi:hypothetical protein
VPLDANDGAHGDVLFEVTLKLPEAMISGYEWVEEGKGYREWLMPAAVLNSHATLVEVSDTELETQDLFAKAQRRSSALKASKAGAKATPENEESRESNMTQTERQHPDQQLAESLQADMELQKAALAYIAEQSCTAQALDHLQELIPWPDGEKVCPAHQRMLDLMPVHLRWPDPIWGDTLFD